MDSDDEYEYSDADDEYPLDDEEDDVTMDDDDDMQWDSSDNPNAAPMTSYKGVKCAPFKSGIRMMAADDVRPEMTRRCNDITEVLGIPLAAATVLLRKQNWSKEDLLEAYMMDSDKILKAAGVYHRCGNEKPDPKLKMCPICYEHYGEKDFITMPCGHSFSKSCWNKFCENAIDEGPSCVHLTCPHAGCNEMVTEVEMRKSLEKKTDYQKYLTYQLRSFVDSNPYTRWCPGPGCERIACAQSASAMEAEGCVAHCDTCPSHFCIKCGEEPHAPATCKDLSRWLEKCRNESETANWILANTKSCPKCMSRIEKNQGCNHMTCQRCKYEFCWICMGDWADHGANTGGYYKCNKFDEDANKEASDAAQAKRDLDRYLHFYKRFHAHQEAQNFALKQLKETEQRMIRLQETTNDAKWSDVEFLKAANEQLVECRQVLKYTYVFGYYLDPNRKMQRERFEHHQEMLERFTENLSELSEKPLNEMHREDVVNQTRVVDRFTRNILKYVDEGMEDM